MMAPSWKLAALALPGLSDEVRALLDAFRPAGEARAGALEGAPGPEPQPVAAARVHAALAGEVDAAQAAMFGRRLAAVESALGLGVEDQLLRSLLRGRLVELLEGPRPRALRVRALADFVYSQHARLSRGGRGPTVEQLAATVRWDVAVPGVDQAVLSGLTQLGPQRVHLLRLDPARVRLRTLARHDRVAAGEGLAEHAVRVGALAAFSGGFFLYSEPDIAPPSVRKDAVGLLVDEGRVLSPPCFSRSTLIEDDAGRWHIASVGPAEAVLPGIDWASVRFTSRARAAVATGAAGGSVALVGDRVVAVAGPDQPLAVPLNGLVLGSPTPLGLAVGDPLGWTVPGVRSAMAGGPRLVRDGQPLADLAAAPLPSPQLVAEDFAGTAPPRTFSQDETGDRNLLPRLAVGLDPRGGLVVAAVDGRDLDGALGLTLSATARLMAALGCRSAMNLDGGSSKRLVLGKQVLDRPSTEILGAGQAVAAHRPVHTAVLVLPR